MAFKLKSGNRTSFKSMGSSPAKDMKTGSYEHSFESPTKQKKEKTYPKSYTKEDIKFLREQREDVVRREDLDEKGKAMYDANKAKSKKKNLDRKGKSTKGLDKPTPAPGKQKKKGKKACGDALSQGTAASMAAAYDEKTTKLIKKKAHTRDDYLN